mgnify:CR=1 FL=1
MKNDDRFCLPALVFLMILISLVVTSVPILSYASIALIAGHGLLAFRDPYGIRPLVLGKRIAQDNREEWILASESLVLENGDYEIVRDIEPGEAIFITSDGRLYSNQCSKKPLLIPCSLISFIK